MALRDRVRDVVDGRRFQRFVITVIVVNAVTLGCETSPALVGSYGELFDVLDSAALAVFVVELAARLYAHGPRFFRDPWNCFDFAVVGVALLPAAGPLSVVRALRILRALRLVAMVPSMRRVVTALVKSIPGLLSLSGLLVLMLYVGSVVAINLFRAGGDPRFGDLGATVLTLFQITTGDGWSDVMRDLMATQPWAWVFFLVYLLVGTFTMLNLFIAVVCSAMESEAAPSRAGADDRLLAEVRALREEVRALHSTPPNPAESRSLDAVGDRR
ncbi:ion transporter [Saccharothrix saharensis]|uniref:ion transporter n=1 Tax=Saccharothrix saharensis TaxID=571190 RepID=UPI00369988A1